MHRSRMVRNIRLGIENLLLHKLRSMLTVLGIVFGVGSVIAMLSVGEGASQEALERIRKLGSRNIIVTSAQAIEEESQGQYIHTSIYGLTYEDHERVRQTFPTVTRTVPAKMLRREARLGTRTREVRIVGTTPEWFELVRRRFLAGRPISEGDERHKRTVVVLTEQGARDLLATEHSIGQTLRIGGNYMEVIGILRSEGETSGNVQTPDEDTDAYIPLQVARERFGDMNARYAAGSRIRERVELHKMILEVDHERNVRATADALENMLQRFHDKKDYQISIPLALLQQARQTKRTFNIVLGSIACISLLVGGIGIMNIMLASVTERTREIGIRRAIGARRRQIVGQFLVETVVLSCVGGAVGIGMGVVIPWLITWFSDMPTVVTGWSVLLSLGISVAIGVVFGLYPAFRAADLDPIVALRHE